MYGLSEIKINKLQKTLNLKKIKMDTVFGIVVIRTDKDIP